MQKIETLAFSPNPLHAKLLQNLYFHKTQSFLSFCYHSTLILPFNAGLGSSLWNICQDELLHIKTLGCAISAVGDKPAFCDHTGRFINLKKLCENFTSQEIVYAGIEIKENLVILEKTTLEKLSSPQIKNIVRSILKNDECHLKILKNIDKKI